MKLLEGKITLITGGTRGIGKAIALSFADHGATVVFTYRSSVEKAKAVEAEIKAKGVPCMCFQADASNMDEIQGVIGSIVEAYERLDVIVNNAGITKDNLLLRMNAEQWDAVIQTNLSSVFYACKAGLKPMLRQRSGSFINISSIVGLQGNAGQANYAASKAGIIGFTKSLAKEVGSRGIRANVVAPGFIATEMTEEIPEKEMEAWMKDIPLKRAGSTKEVSDLCVFLASDMSTYITGEVISITGGLGM